MDDDRPIRKPGQSGDESRSGKCIPVNFDLAALHAPDACPAVAAQRYEPRSGVRDYQKIGGGQRLRWKSKPHADVEHWHQRSLEVDDTLHNTRGAGEGGDRDGSNDLGDGRRRQRVAACIQSENQNLQ